MLTALLAIPVVALVLAISSTLNGWVLTKLWGWFIAPLFGLPALHLAPAIGLALVVHYLTYQHIDGAKGPDSKSWTVLLAMFLRPFVVLGVGAIVHCFV